LYDVKTIEYQDRYWPPLPWMMRPLKPTTSNHYGLEGTGQGSVKAKRTRLIWEGEDSAATSERYSNSQGVCINIATLYAWWNS